jgi:photosystem II stability/assembly factor-like uncharacterized protein
MVKSKIIMVVFGLFLTLAGCGVANSHNSGHTSNASSQIGNKRANQQTSSSDSTSSALNTQKPESTGTSISGQSSSSVSVPPEKNPAAQMNKPDMSSVTAVRLADFNTGWVGGNGWIAKTTTQGRNWAVVYQGVGTVRQIFALNHLDVWAAMSEDGNTLKLIHSSDGGQHWMNVGKMPNQSFFHFITKTNVLSGNDLSQDGGKTWHSMPIPKDSIGDAYFHDENNGWVISQEDNVLYVNRTTDGGTTWKTVMTKTLISPLNGAVIRSAGINDAWVELIGDTGMTQTSYSLLHTSDGGKSWNTVIANSTAGGGPAPGIEQNTNKGPLNKGSSPGPLYVVSSKTAFMGGVCPACENQNSIGWTKDAGKTWVNSNATLEGSGDAFIAISDLNHGWWITTDTGKQSSLYITSDGGYHWKNVYVFH